MRYLALLLLALALPADAARRAYPTECQMPRLERRGNDQVLTCQTEAGRVPKLTIKDWYATARDHITLPMGAGAFVARWPKR